LAGSHAFHARPDRRSGGLTGYLEWRFTGAPRTVPEIIGLGAVGVLAFIISVVGSALIL
jgi:hypothetical protein